MEKHLVVRKCSNYEKYVHYNFNFIQHRHLDHQLSDRFDKTVYVFKINQFNHRIYLLYKLVVLFNN